MVEGDGLENRWACKRLVGSNPTLSARCERLTRVLVVMTGILVPITAILAIPLAVDFVGWFWNEVPTVRLVSSPIMGTAQTGDDSGRA